MKFSQKTDKHGFTVITIDPGENVSCDLCNKDYTMDDAKGGILFCSSAACPDCAPKMEEGAKKYNEEKYIVDRAKADETFRDFVYRVRRRV